MIVSVNRKNKEYTKERNRAMKGSMKKILTLSLCVCMLASGTVYAQEESIEGQEIETKVDKQEQQEEIILEEEQEIETEVDKQEQQEEIILEEQQNIETKNDTSKTVNSFIVDNRDDLPELLITNTNDFDIEAVYRTFGVSSDVATTKIWLTNDYAIDGNARDNEEYLKELVEKTGETLYGICPRVMLSIDYGQNIMTDGMGWITDGFGSITLSFNTGIENAGKKAVVYQLYNASMADGKVKEMIPYTNLTVDNNGMVTITTTKLTISAFAIAFQKESAVSNTIKTNTNTSEVRADASGINADAVYKAFGIDKENTNAEIIVEQKEATEKNKKYLTDYALKSGDKILNIYDVVMNLYGDGEYKGTVTDNFGNLKLSFYAGTEYKGKKAVVYQLHGEDEVITYKDLVIDDNGMATITVSKLSTFAVVLQDSAVADTNNTNTIRNSAPRTGDSANIVLWSVTALFAMFVIVSAIMKRTGNK